MEREAESSFPDETGGVLMGYSGADVNQTVITGIIGPGPLAHHGRHSYEPDSDYQEREIGQHYADAEGTEVYLGDWHTHPKPSLRPTLSRVDRRTLARVARHPEARAPFPIMAVLSLSGGDGWSVAVWQLVMRPSGFLWTRRIRSLSVVIE